MTVPTTHPHQRGALPASVRDRFAIFERLTYINSCSQGALSDDVRAAYEDYLTGLETAGSDWATWVGKHEQARALVGDLLHTPAETIAVTASASAALNALTSSIDFTGPRNVVVTTDLDFPTTAQILHAQSRRGAEVRTVRTGRSGVLDLGELEKVVDERTALVSVPHICYRNGAHVDLAPVIELAHRHGALVVVDAYQSVGALPIDVQELKPDFLVGGMLKYLLSSPGVGFMYADPDTTSHLVPTATGWFAARDVFAMSTEGFDPATEARRYEAGTPAVPSLYAACAGINLMLQIGVQATADHVADLCRQLREGVVDLQGTVTTPEGSPGPLIAIRSTDAEALVAAMAQRGVVVSSRDGNVRVSPHCYNSPADIDHALSILRAEKGLLA
ncbi:aminotransferase class V-fold PLP-dependent enzyme [Georgenia sp. 10Sc9-8]|uniref:Aminotransferase class V-fold PLP-dependent enzyme n=1 Tax=Georgenia halotolerans TaxID=3028317 RepID=A0ABT5TXZ8_9MICO|nr:aminotransferase class V-fold PLP-dependent enzyme [Georgenia halotolerans]